MADNAWRQYRWCFMFLVRMHACMPGRASSDGFSAAKADKKYGYILSE
jgi:hypothetical protein